MPRSSKPRRKTMRPLEFIVLAFVVGIFTGLIVLLSSRDVGMAVTWLGIAFIVMLVVSATLVLMVKPSSDDDSVAGSEKADQVG